MSLGSRSGRRGADRLQRFRLAVAVGDVRVDLAGMWRDGTGIPLVFFHGFGTTKEDYADIAQQESLSDRPVLAYDAPGCGATTCSDLAALSIPFLVSVASEVLRARRIERCHLIGHSMGGLTGLLLADQDPTKVVSFVNIEGNLAPEDSFLSRQIVSHPHPDPRTFFDQLTDRVWNSGSYSSGLYASALPHKVRVDAVRPIFESMVDLTRLAENDIELAEISHSAHFPMYSNAPEMWSRIEDFILRSSVGSLRSRGAPTRPPWRRSPAGPRHAGRRPPGRRW